MGWAGPLTEQTWHRIEGQATRFMAFCCLMGATTWGQASLKLYITQVNIFFTYLGFLMVGAIGVTPSVTPRDAAAAPVTHVTQQQWCLNVWQLCMHALLCIDSCFLQFSVGGLCAYTTAACLLHLDLPLTVVTPRCVIPPQARANGHQGEAVKHLQSAQRIITWLAVTNKDQPWAGWAQSELVPHLAAMCSELAKQARLRSAVLETQALSQPEPELPSAAAMLQWGEDLKHTALAAAASVAGSGLLPVDTALLVRDAAMVVTGMGHTALMHRGSVILSIKASQYASTPCPKGSRCPAPDICHGNRLERVPAAAALSREQRARTFTSPYSTLPQPHQLQLVIPHHKTTHQAVAGPALPFTCPLACQLLEVYERRARPVLDFVAGEYSAKKARRDGGGGGAAAGAAAGAADSPQALFLDDHGRAFTSESICNWWREAHRWGAVIDRRCVGERRVGAATQLVCVHMASIPACVLLAFCCCDGILACQMLTLLTFSHSASLYLTLLLLPAAMRAGATTPLSPL